MKKPHLDFIKELKNTLHIPLQKAMALAHQHGEHIEKCRNALYQLQINSLYF